LNAKKKKSGVTDKEDESDQILREIRQAQEPRKKRAIKKHLENLDEESAAERGQLSTGKPDVGLCIQRQTTRYERRKAVRSLITVKTARLGK